MKGVGSNSSIINIIMDYKKIYDNLIEYRKVNIPEGYTENHHIIPRSLGGDNSKNNLVRLTGREHWIAHLLLYKITKLGQMAYACHMMTMRCEEREIPFIKNSRMYEEIRIKCAKLVSERHKQNVGEKNSQFGTIWICNVETKQNKKILKTDQLPEGWVKGRNVWNKKKIFRPTKGSIDHRKMMSLKVKNYFSSLSDEEKKLRFKHLKGPRK